ncbi:response regulator [Labilibaculum sp.]|uniref:hybrid sensor histidine kinase/response regulator n=1 Tax=Labilibaculum sp. TaxID=2060723 RepID=UPI0035616237
MKINTNNNPKIKILTVDDNPKNIQVLGSILRDAGYSIGFAYDGQQAIDLLKETPDFDLVLMDVNMPVMNGMDACKAMRADKNLTEIPVIFLTALNDSKDIVAGFDAGGQDYVTKPFNSKEILSRVKTHIELKRSKDQLKEINLLLEEKVEERTQELKESNSHLEKAYEELSILDKSKSDFLAMISHQINTPLNGILGFIGLLKDELSDSHLKEMFSYLETSANRLDSFAKVSLKITELRTKQVSIKKADINFDQLLQLSQQHLAEKINTKNISIQTKENNQNRIIKGNPELIEFCIESILDNAIKFSPKGSSIQVQCEKNDENIRCSFIDEGKGFSSKELSNLFQLFATGDEYADENKGLDLALVQLIMEAHKGSVIAANNNSKGAIVCLIFPI